MSGHIPPGGALFRNRGSVLARRVRQHLVLGAKGWGRVTPLCSLTSRQHTRRCAVRCRRLTRRSPRFVRSPWYGDKSRADIYRRAVRSSEIVEARWRGGSGSTWYRVRRVWGRMTPLCSLTSQQRIRRCAVRCRRLARPNHVPCEVRGEGTSDERTHTAGRCALAKS